MSNKTENSQDYLNLSTNTREVAVARDTAESYMEHLFEVPGYFSRLDAELFAHCCREQHDLGVEGDLLEIGVWYGRSAVLLGFLKFGSEQLHVNDLFGQLPKTETGRSELEQAGPIKLPTTDDFLGHYLRYHDSNPVIHRGPSTEVRDDLAKGTYRFIHIDGSHTQEAVAHDIKLARELLKEGGIIVFDDYSNTDHLGVAAALWPALAESDIAPFAATPSKLYATLGLQQAGEYRQDLLSWANQHDLLVREQTVNNSKLLSLRTKFNRVNWIANRIKRSLPNRLRRMVAAERF
ncbi:class I SAM-dependent methyltransferase [Pelagicoccus mobilis]|uniref:Class I SAM-dependent methyltransferase n=1 Tax=Pelagicoccus mobilis TaxID=415221 RepID=A0A934VRT8_9BACT|nr:class I SAM-dependent methyltransferase [Pelagicoccus mobilis]MBK1877958.1 class I SAM-dependent methyltransferase [Pelagicoccus mobilis]